MKDSRARLDYLNEVIPLLYPAPTPADPALKGMTRRTRGEARHAAYAVVPNRLVPRRLVPRARWAPGRRRLPHGPRTIDGHLSEVLGQPVRATVHVRPALRANRKPVLELYGASGELLAFVKIGDTDRSRALVRHESATLDLLSAVPLRSVVPPGVLHHGTWNDLDVLVLSPLPVRRGRISPASIERAIEEIATLDVPAAPAGHDRHQPGHSPHTRHGDHRSHTWRGDRPPYAWHGDLSPWNIASAPGGRLFVWDWERFATGVPLGFDALHHFLQRALRRMTPRVAAEACLAQAVRVLAPFGLSAGEARETAVRYLIALADRHDRDGHQPLGPCSQWLSPLLDHQEVLP